MTNSLTEVAENHLCEDLFRRRDVCGITFDPTYMSAKKRRAQGIGFLESGDPEEDALNQKFQTLCQDVDQNPSGDFPSV